MRLRTLFITMAVLGATLVSLSGPVFTPVSAAPPPSPEVQVGANLITVRVAPPNQLTHIGPPQGYAPPGTPGPDSINVNYLPAGSDPYGIGDTCIAWPAGAQTAFNYAVSTWNSLLLANGPVVIDACWANNLPSGVLGHGGFLWSSRDFTGAPVAGTYYTGALVNTILGYDGYTAYPEIYIAYSSIFSWNYDPYTAPTGSQVDLPSVALHEIAHGLGFSGGARYGATYCTNATWGCWANATYPYAYDRFIENGSGQAIFDTATFPSPSAALGTQFTSNNLYFDGTHANAGNNNARAKIYAPTTWSQGSSYAHLDYTTFGGTANRLMVYAISYGDSIHDPGHVTMGLLRDIGWPTTLSAAYVSSTAACSGNLPCYTSIAPALSAVNTGGTVTVYAGTYNESVNLSTNKTLTFSGASTINGNVTISAGTFNAPAANLTIAGNFTRSAGTFNHNSGTVIFSGAATRNLATSTATTFYNLTVNSGTVLAETVATDNVTVANTLTNSGTLRKSKSGLGAGSTTFGITGASINVATVGTLTALQVDRVGSPHPNENFHGGGDHILNTYYTLTPTGGVGSAEVCLAYTQAEYDGGHGPGHAEADLRLCRWTGTGWTCPARGANSNTSTNRVCATGQTQFSDWVMGQVNPTAIEVNGASTRAPADGATGLILPGLLVLLAVAGLGGLWVRRRATERAIP